MAEIFTPYTVRERTAEPKALLALQKVRGLEELILGWVVQNRTLSVSPLAGSGSQLAAPGASQSLITDPSPSEQTATHPKISSLDVQFSRSGRRVGGGALHLEYVLSFLPPITSVAGALEPSGTPSEDWFDRRNAALGIDLDTEYDLNRCPPRSLSQLMLGYLLNRDAVCTVRSTGTSKNPQVCIELVYLAPVNPSPHSPSPHSPSPSTPSAQRQEAETSTTERLGWKEVCLVHRTALENFVPHVYWV